MLPVSRLFVIGADGCLVVTDDTNFVRMRTSRQRFSISPGPTGYEMQSKTRKINHNNTHKTTTAQPLLCWCHLRNCVSVSTLPVLCHIQHKNCLCKSRRVGINDKHSKQDKVLNSILNLCPVLSVFCLVGLLKTERQKSRSVRIRIMKWMIMCALHKKINLQQEDSNDSIFDIA